MSTVYPIGYSKPGAQERIDALPEQTLIIDTRYKPYSKWSNEFCKEALVQKYGDRYKWAGEYLGNLNYKGGPIKIANPTVGIAGLTRYLNEQHDLVLLCQCREFSKCHVNTICSMLSKEMPEVEIVHDKPPCAVCGEPATLASPSGRPEGLYCEQHGHCSRCHESVEKFVKYPYGDFFACACVVAYAEKTRMGEEMKQCVQVALF